MTKNNIPEKNKAKTIRVLMVDDSEDDVVLTIRELQKGGYHPDYIRIQTAPAMRDALKNNSWDIILCDYKMPQFNAVEAIRLLREANLDIPIIIVSGTIGEETAVECMRLGAQDYIMKGKFSRLCPAIAREMEEVTIRKNQRFSESQKEAALEALRQSEEQYRSILENMQEGYYEVDLAGNYTFVNASICRNIGYSRDELINLNYKQYTEAQEAARVFEAFNKVYKTGEPIQEFSWAILKKNKSRMYMTGSIELRRDATGNAIGFKGIIRNITESKFLEDKLREEEKKFRVIAEQSSDIILMINKKGVITYENGTVNKLLGYAPEDRIGASALENIHPEDLKSNVEKFRNLFSDIHAPLLSTEVRIRHKDGSWRTFEEMASGLVRDNVVESVVINLRDITERKRAEETLRKSEKFFKEITENSSDITIIVDQEGKITYCSPSVERFTGYRPEEVIGKSGFLFIHPEELERANRDFSEALLMKDAPPPPNSFRIIHKDGSERYFYGMGKNLLDNPDIAGIVMNVHDITERRKAEETIKKSEEKYRNIFENAMEGIYQATNEGRFITVNAAFARMAGYDSPEDLIESITDISTQLYVHPEDRDRFLAVRKEKGLVDNFEVEFYKKDKSTFWVVINARAVKNEKGRILYTEGLIEDITLRKQTENQLHTSLERLKKAVNTTIQVLVSALEIRDPYTAGHQTRSADLASAIAKEMGLNNEKIEAIRMAGIIHDIGKLSIPVEILSKPTRLTNLEYSLIKEHSQSGYDMLKDVDPSWPLAEIVYQHHERMDGSGYPRNLKGEDILLEARILSVADVVEAMASHRPYRASLGIGPALEEIEKNKGILYDKFVADACLRLFREKGYTFEK